MKRLMMIGIAGLCAGLAGCGAQSRFLTKDGELADSWTATSDRTYVRVVGIGVAPDSIKETTRRRGVSRNSALVNARTELVAFLRGVRLKGSVDVSRLAEQRDLVRQIVNATVAGAETERTDWTADDGCVVVLRIERSRIKKMLRDAERLEATETEDARSPLEKEIASLDARTRALMTALPGMKQE